MRSIGQMLELIHGMVDTDDLTTWESDFVESTFERYEAANKWSSTLSAKQVAIIERIHNKHFA